MNKQKAIVFLIVALLSTATASVLNILKNRERLGAPGVRLALGEVEFPDGKKVFTNRVELPETVLGYKSEPIVLSEVEINGLPADTTFGRRIYKAEDGFETLISVVLMGSDRSSLHPPQYCLAGLGWKIEREEEAEVRIDHPNVYNLPVRRLIVRGDIQVDGRPVRMSGVYVYWFVADKKLHNGQRLWGIDWQVLRTGILDRWAYVTYFSTCLPGEEEGTFNRMKEFITISVPQFQLTSVETSVAAKK